MLVSWAVLRLPPYRSPAVDTVAVPSVNDADPGDRIIIATAAEVR